MEETFMDQPINDLIKQYDKVRKVSTEQDDDNIPRCLLYYAYFKNNYRVIAVDLSKQKALDPDPRAIQKIVLQGKPGQKIVHCKLLLKNQKKHF